jgi:hypothetical protein
MENTEPKYGTWVQNCNFETRRSISNKEIKLNHHSKIFPVKFYDNNGKMYKEIKNPALIGE